MDKKQLQQALVNIKEQKRNFKQSVDLIINLKNLDLKNPDHQVEFFIQIPHQTGKKLKIAALVGAELLDQSKEVMDETISQAQFADYQKDKIKTKNLASSMDFFVAQATIMPKVAGAFGRVFGPKGKMPNPKAGCVVPPNANLQAVYDRLQKTVKVSGKKAPIVQVMVGKEDLADDHIIENINTIYNNLVHHLPQGENNVKSVYIKTTMGKPIKIA